MNGSAKAGVGQDPMLDLVNTRDYVVGYNDSPASIAKKFGLALSSLLAANPQKPTKVVAGVTTFRELLVGETLNVPTVGLSGPDATGVGFNFFKAALLPWGAISETEKAFRHHGAARRVGRPRSDQTWERWRQVHPGTPYSDYQNWWNQYGGPSGGTIGDAAGVGDVVSDTLAALSQVDPCSQTYVGMVCSAQSVLGLTPDGKWGSGSAGAAKARGLSAPPGCSPRPSWWAPVGQSNCGMVSSSVPIPVPLPVPDSTLTMTVPTVAQQGSFVTQQAAATALAAMNADPNYCSSVGQPGSSVNSAVHNFKASWNAANPQSPVPIGTGRYEPVTAAALASALGGASVPAGCGVVPVPGPYGGGGGMPQPQGGKSAQLPQGGGGAQPQGGGGAQPSPGPLGPPPPPGPVTHHGISTGAIVAAAIGAAALVGIVAIAATSKGRTTTRYRKGKTKIKYRTRRAPRRFKRKTKR